MYECNQGLALPCEACRQALNCVDVGCLAILSWHCGWLGRGGGVVSHKAAHPARSIFRGVAILRAPSLPGLQRTVQEEPTELVALPLDNLSQMRSRSSKTVSP